jgi:hypothetical protein
LESQKRLTGELFRGECVRLSERTGFQNRHIASTRMNKDSSRSHTVVMVHLQGVKEDGGRQLTHNSKLHLIDLAGSERMDAVQTGTLYLICWFSSVSVNVCT